MKHRLGLFTAIWSLMVCTAINGGTVSAAETIPVWPGTPAGARPGDDGEAAKLASALSAGTHKARIDICRGTRIPTIDVYLPPKEKRSGTAMIVYCGGGYGAVCIGTGGWSLKRGHNENPTCALWQLK